MSNVMVQLIGYARVSTDDQDTQSQFDALSAAGCHIIHEDKASGSKRTRPALARAIEATRQGDTFIVYRIDRLARSLSHLLEIIETLRAKGVYFRSLKDPIDTSTPQGMLMTQCLGAFAEFERALIRERTNVGVRAAMARGAKPGNPKMRARDPAAILDLKRGHQERYLHQLIDSSAQWLPTVERLRPHLPWEFVLRQVRAIDPPVRSFTVRTLVKGCKALVKDGRANPDILLRSKTPPADIRNVRLVADRIKSYPDASLRDIATWLSRGIRQPTPRGGLTWSAEAVRRLKQKAIEMGLIDNSSD
jgi:DNA invertase Pin-like site-specific DNA recombinase